MGPGIDLPGKRVVAFLERLHAGGPSMGPGIDLPGKAAVSLLATHFPESFNGARD